MGTHDETESTATPVAGGDLRQRARDTAVAWLPAAACYGAIFALIRRMALPYSEDPDRYFHLALARLTAEEGLVRRLPQVEDLGWGLAFPEKEWLFHALGGLAHALGGEGAVLALVPILNLAALWALAAAATLRSPRWIAGATLAALGPLAAIYSSRLSMMRPHTLAVALFAGILWAVLARRAWAAALLAALFALAYHAFYLPAAVLGVFLLLRLRGDALGRRAALAGLGGLAAGTVANPYFPESFEMGLYHLRIAVSASHKGDSAYAISENRALALGEWLANFGVPSAAALAALGAVIWWIAARRQRGQGALEALRGYAPARDALALSACAAALWLLTARSNRTLEYAFPLTLAAVPWAIALVPRRTAAAIAVLATALIWNLPYSARWLRGASALESGVSEKLEAIRAIPAGASGAKVFNCEWDSSAYILYLRPDLRFVDVLDPGFLARAKWEKAVARQDFRLGWIADPHRMLRSYFQADFVYCRDPEVIRQLDSDPDFRKLATSGRYAVFQLPAKRASNHLTRFEAGPVDPARSESPASWAPIELGAASADTAPLPYVDFFRWLKTDVATKLAPAGALAGDVICAHVRPDPAELTRHAGATWLGIGGGRYLSAVWNGRAWFRVQETPELPRLLHHWAALPAPLRPQDRLELRVCAPATSRYMGVSLSLWKPQDLKELCGASSPEAGANNLPCRGAKFVENRMKTGP